MVVPFSNTKLRVPKGFQSLLVGLSTEVLRSQPKNIHAFAADYFEKLLRRREQGHEHTPGKQTAQEDRYYNNQSFQESYPVNHPDVNNAATKIQAQYRGHKTRQDHGKMTDENKDNTDEEEESPTHGHGTTATSAREEQTHHHQVQHGVDDQSEKHQPDRLKYDQERAATTIQAQFRGYQTRRNMRESNVDSHHQPPHSSNEHHQDFEHGHENSSALQSVRSNQPLDSDRHDSHLNFTREDHIDIGEHGHTTDRSLDNFQLDHDQRSTGSHNDDDDDDDMNDPNLDKAATRIQASYRGYKTRKELGSPGGHSNSGREQHHPDHQPPAISPRMVGDFDSARSKNILSPSAEGNRAPVGEDDDNAAAVKIQAAYRGYRVRKDLEK